MKRPGITLMAILLLFTCTSLSTAGTLTDTWAGLDVTITYPDKVTYNTPFDVNFLMDGSALGGTDAVAFLTNVSLSNTVDVSGVTWAYDFISDDPVYDAFDTTGSLGDANTPYTSGIGGFSIDLIDPYSPPYTWLWDIYNDQVSWTLENFIIKGDTSLLLTLDDKQIVSTGQFAGSVIVLDPPSGTIPEPDSGWLMLMAAGFAGLAAMGRKDRRYT